MMSKKKLLAELIKDVDFGVITDAISRTINREIKHQGINIDIRVERYEISPRCFKITANFKHRDMGKGGRG
jgi:hypothetical protein